MALITLNYVFTVGTTIIASQTNLNNSVIYNDYNGNITDANISPTAAIEYTKLALNGTIKGTDTVMPNTANNIVVLNSSGQIPLSISVFPYVKCSNTQASGVGGGSITLGSFQTVLLNTKDNDTSSISTLTTNAISLPAGTYLVKASAPFIISGSSSAVQLRLYNNTATAVALNGQTGIPAAGSGAGSMGNLSGQFTLLVTSSLLLQAYYSGSGTGTQGNPLSTGDSEVYAIIEFTKVA